MTARRASTIWVPAIMTQKSADSSMRIIIFPRQAFAVIIYLHIAEITLSTEQMRQAKHGGIGHWGAAIVVGCAVATVATCGGFAAAAGAVAAVCAGTAAASTAATVAASAFVGSAAVYGSLSLSSLADSASVEDFNNKGNWGTVASTAGGAIVGGVNGYTVSKALTPKTVGRGMHNPKIRAAAQRGVLEHKQMDYGPNVDKEVTIASGCRVDGIDFKNRIIYELKPNNPRAIARGLSQLNRYTEAASQRYGGKWTGTLRLYD